MPLGIPQKILLIKIWNIKEIVLSNELKQKDKLANELPFGYV
ncbi:cytolethal distending toxin C [Campylobacter jejuni HB-CJGB-LC]|nr:cytolethal distending toxin C [Campylobacter jejuni HB-CJGB-LC]